MFASFDGISSMPFGDLKETNRHGWTHGWTHGQKDGRTMENRKQYTCPHTQFVCVCVWGGGGGVKLAMLT